MCCGVWFTSNQTVFPLVTENAVLFRDSGESVTLQCSTAECPNRNENFMGLYLNHIFEKPEKVLYYYQKESNEMVTPSEKFKNRIKTNGSLKNNTITISNVTIEDAGLYECSYRNVLEDIKVTCKVYTLFVRGKVPLFSFKYFAHCSFLKGGSTEVERSL